MGDNVTDYMGSFVNCTKEDVLTASGIDYLNTVLIPGAIAFLSSALNVNRVVGNLSMTQTTCNGITIPQDHQTTGVADADVVIYVPVGATACVKDQDGRPVVGHVNFSPSLITTVETPNPLGQAFLINLAIHQVFHALWIAAPFFSSGYINMQAASV